MSAGTPSVSSAAAAAGIAASRSYRSPERTASRQSFFLLDADPHPAASRHAVAKRAPVRSHLPRTLSGIAARNLFMLDELAVPDLVGMLHPGSQLLGESVADLRREPSDVVVIGSM